MNGFMEIISSVFQNEGTIPRRYTCAGLNVSPALLFSEVPAEAKSLALIMDDPDAPGGTFDHWILWNIDPSTTKIVENSRPDEAMEGQNGYGVGQYKGPCPPPGKPHHYFFKLYALDTVLDLPALSSKQTLEQAMQNRILAQAELIGMFAREPQ